MEQELLASMVSCTGGLSRKLKEHTTKELWKQVSDFGMLSTGEVVVTDSGGLEGYKQIFHAVGLNFWWKGTSEGLEKCARNIVRRAIECGSQSVAVPLIGSGHGGLSADESEAAIRSGLAKSAARTSNQSSISITVVRYPGAQSKNRSTK